MRKLSESDIRDIKQSITRAHSMTHRERGEKGVSYSKLAERFGVSKSTIEKIGVGTRRPRPVIQCAICERDTVQEKSTQKTCGDEFCLEVHQRTHKVADPQKLIAEARKTLAEKAFMDQCWNRVLFMGAA